ERPWQLATRDGLVDGVTTEIKTAGFGERGWDEGVPAHVNAQVQHQLDTLDEDRAYVAVLLGGCRLKWAEIHRDDSFIAMLRAECAELWRRIEANEPPPVDASEPTRAALALLYPEDNGLTVALPGDLIELDRE